VVDELGNISKYIYDDSGNLTSLYFEIDGETSTTNYSYNECFEYSGDECIQTSSLYDKTEFTSSANNEVIKDYHYETSALYRLDFIRLSINALDIKQEFNFSGNTTRIENITYDISENGVDFKYEYIYDELGNIIQESYYEGTTLATQYYYEYDALNQLVVEDVYINGGSSYSKVYEYDKRGNRTATTTYAYEYRETGATIPTATILNLEDEYIPYYDGNTIYTTMKEFNVGETDTELEFVFVNQQTQVSYSRSVTYSTNLDTLLKGYYTVNYTARDLSIGLFVRFSVIINIGNLASTAGTATGLSSYIYSSAWKDQLSSYITVEDGVSTSHVLTYDDQGNPTFITNFKYNDTVYYGAYLYWSGRELNTIIVMQGSSTPMYRIEYKYNDNGYRTSKKFYTYSDYTPILTEAIDYELIDDKVVYETNGTYGILYTYDYDGTLIGFNYDSDVTDQTDGLDYFYLRNQQGDITTIINSSGTVVTKYNYDAYGNTTIVLDNLSGVNQYTYKGYRYDSETNLYYLNSRYYNPEVGRFINADGLVGDMGDIQSSNMYSYCANNPVNRGDESGYFWNIIAGAGIGFLVGFTVNLAVQAFNGQDIDLTDALISGASGALSGVLAASGFGLATMAVGNGLISSAENVATNLVKGETINALELGVSFTVGVVAGLIGGKGFKADKAYNSAVKQMTKAMDKAAIGSFSTLQGCKSALTQGANRLFREFSNNFTKTLGKLIVGESVSEILTDFKDAIIPAR
jgi:RHS repeat-associated protein